MALSLRVTKLPRNSNMGGADSSMATRSKSLSDDTVDG